jgi:hypothetical protein
MGIMALCLLMVLLALLSVQLHNKQQQARRFRQQLPL